MITDENAIEISDKLPWPSKNQGSSEYFSGFLYEEPATLKYQPIRGTASAQDTMKSLALNKDEHPGIIKLLGYKPDRLQDGEFLIKIYEPFTHTVKSATEEGQIWSEARLLRALVDISGAGEILARRGIRHSRISPDFLLVTTQDCLIKLPLAKEKPPTKDLDSPFTAPEIRNRDQIQEIGLADVYSLGATLAYMCLRKLPAEVEAGHLTWMDYQEEIALKYPLIASLLPKLVVTDQHERYNFKHLRAVVGIGDCLALLRLNEILARKEAKESNKEIMILCKIVGRTFREVEVKKMVYLVCRSCKAREEDIGQVGFSCSCGALNLR